MSKRLEGRVALITGAASGIGKSTAQRLADEGAAVLVTDIQSDAGELTVKELLAGGARAAFFTHDVTSEADWEAAVAKAVEEFGGLDILVNNAGMTIDKTMRKMTPEEWDHVIHVNLSGAFYLSRAILQHMLDRNYGRIVNISSVIGSSGAFGQANYASAKSGLFGLTMSLALETAAKGITVNAVTPGYITTDMTAAVPGNVMDKLIANIPVGRLGEPNEVARVVEFLADPESAYITGQVYPVNGGLYM